MRLARSLAMVFGAVTIATVSSCTAEPVKGPLETRWAAQVSQSQPWPEYPRPQMVRDRWLNLNGPWQLDFDRPMDSVPAGVELAGKVLVPFPIESALSGVKRHADRVWYRRTFEVPMEWEGKRVLLHFGAVDWEATVYVNGKELGTHRGGYDGFSFDITDVLRRRGQQELVVRVLDPTDGGNQPRGKQVVKPDGIWYTPTTGIWQTVWLEPVSVSHIEEVVFTSDIEQGRVRARVRGAGVTAEDTIQAVLRDGPKEVGRGMGRVGDELVVSIPKDRRKLWSPDQPFLYDVELTLKHNQKAVDEVTSYVGLRKIDVGPDSDGTPRLRLNGQPLFAVGPLDQGFWPDGIYTAPTDEALRYDIEVTRQLGFNMTRKHVKVEPDRWYYWCDKLGLLVWQDMPSGNNTSAESKKQFEVELKRLIQGRYNHPSVIMWVVFNEGWGQHDTERYVAMVKSMDPTRLVNNASGWTDQRVGDVHDIHDYPGPSAPAKEAARAGVLGEFGGLGLPVQGHLWTEKNWGYRKMGDAEQLRQRYVGLLRQVWGLQQGQGLSAAVYTQLTDVETECNGLLTYDRAVIKADPKQIEAANLGRIPKLTFVLPTAKTEAGTWRYTTTKPADAWYKPEFDAGAWTEGQSGFGTKGTPGAVVRTEWNTPEIWLRREISLPQLDPRSAVLWVHHDEDVEIYLNGVLAAKGEGYTTDYEEMPLAAAAALKAGKNVLAVHCRQTGGGQYIDVGIASVSAR